jgi:hypothetical protein
MGKRFLSLMFGIALTLGGVAMAQQEPAPQSPDQGPGQESRGADQVFAALDTNKDGKVSENEFTRLFEMEGQASASAQEKQQEFKSWDTDSDGSISKAEFAAKYGR